MTYYLIIGIACYTVIEVFMKLNSLSLFETMEVILNDVKHKELKEAYSLTTLHFLFSGFCILLWPVVLILLVVK